MVGHKVRCQCGFVFRLGSKADKQAWVANDLKRKKAIKAESKRKQNEQSKISPRDSTSRKQDALAGRGDPDEEVLDAIPIAEPSAAHPNGSLFENMDEVLDAIPAELISPDPAVQTGSKPLPNALDHLLTSESPSQSKPDIFAPISAGQVPLRPPKATRSAAAKHRRTKSKKRNNALKSPALPIWNLVLTFVGLPVILFLAFVFCRNAFDSYQMASVMNRANIMGGVGGADAVLGSGGGATIGLMVAVILALLFLALAASMLTSGIVSILELASSTEIRWATSLASMVASIVIAVLFLTFFWQVYSLLNLVSQKEAIGEQLGRSVDEMKVGRSLVGLGLKYFLFAIVPIAVAITGFARTMKR